MFSSGTKSPHESSLYFIFAEMYMTNCCKEKKTLSKYILRHMEIPISRLILSACPPLVLTQQALNDTSLKSINSAHSLALLLTAEKRDLKANTYKRSEPTSPAPKP